MRIWTPLAMLPVALMFLTAGGVLAQQPDRTPAPVTIDDTMAEPINPIPAPVDRRATRIRLDDPCYRDSSLATPNEAAAWYTLNCRVRQLATTGIAVAGGLTILAVTWAGFAHIQAAVFGGSDVRQGAKIMVVGSLGGFALCIFAYAFATLLNTGLVPYIPYNP